MKIDLGCGRNKQPHYFGIDRRPLPGVDLVCDFNRSIPLPDHSVYVVMAARSLCYADDFFAVMADLYRLCIHKAVVCILAPYAHNFVHLSNPYLKQRFDEHTPRYLTPAFYQPPDSPLCPSIGSYSPDAPPPFDFRLLRMELFYQSPFCQPFYDQEELEVLKGLQANVVHEIMYHFLVVKQTMTTEEMDLLSKQSYPEPLSITELRKKQVQE